jgi:hypothetical protein
LSFAKRFALSAQRVLGSPFLRTRYVHAPSIPHSLFELSNLILGLCPHGLQLAPHRFHLFLLAALGRLPHLARHLPLGLGQSSLNLGMSTLDIRTLTRPHLSLALLR